MTAHQLEARALTVRSQFVRDHIIWVYYSLVGLGCCIMSALGPAMPFLRSQLSMNYRLVGLHFSAFAVGTVLSGALGDRILEKLGTVRTLWLSVAATIVGLVALVVASHPAISICGILLCGFCTSLTYQTLANAISGHLGENRAVAFIEAEVVAMIGGGLAPFAISAFVSAKFGWRAAFISLVVLFIATFPSLNKFNSVSKAAVEQSPLKGRLPLAFWSYALIIFLSVAAEWSTAFWSADFLLLTLQISKAAAAGAVGAFFVGMVLGRYSGSHLVRVHSSSRLLAGSGLISVFGFLLFWLGHSWIVNITGLFLTGLGIANMYPLSFAAAVAASPSQSSKAIARVSLMCGSALLVMPITLSLLADRAGLFTAYSLVGVVLTLCLGMIFYAGNLARRLAS